MNPATTPHRGAAWRGDDSVTWGIACVASLTVGPDPDAVATRLLTLGEAYPWLRCRPGEVITTALDLASLASRPFSAGPLRIAIPGDGRIAVAGHHHAVDGLGLLSVLGALAGTPIHSDAHGLGQRPGRPFARAAASRLREAVLAPPVVVAQRDVPRTGRDVFASATVASRPRSADLVLAAVRATVTWNRSLRRPARRIAVAVGASRRPGGAAVVPRDESAYLRIRGAETMGRDDVAAALRSLPTEPDTPARTNGSVVMSRLAAILSRRLGSTLLVSHLGQVAGDGLEALEFYPVTGGRSGVSLGAATVAGHTTLGLRGRDGRLTAEDLTGLLELVVADLT